MKPIFLVFLLLVGCSNSSTKEHSIYSDYPLQSSVTDFAGLFEKEMKDSLQLKIDQANDHADINVTIVTIFEYPDSLTIKEFTVGLGNYYGLGDKEKDNGVLLLVNMGNRDAYLATGTGIAARLTDAECKQIMDSHVIKNFRNQYFFEGTMEAIEQIGILAKE